MLGLSAARIRLVSGLWLFVYAATHLANHALGLVSLQAMEEGREVFLAFWRLPPVEGLLLLALIVHMAAALVALWQRRGLRLPWVEYLQLSLGLLIPSYLFVHILATGWLHRCCGVEDSYAYLLNLVWPRAAANQVLLILLVWTHGVVGVHRWLRLKPAYRRVQASLLVLAVLLPALAVGGFMAAGREAALRRDLEPTAWQAVGAAQGWPVPEAVRERMVQTPERQLVNLFLMLLLTIVLLRGARSLWERRNLVRLVYPGGIEVAVPRGLTVLEASRRAGIPHVGICGGRGRCSTCRVRVGQGADRLPPPSSEEARVLARIGAGPEVRLACQIRPTATLALAPLMPADATIEAVLRPAEPTHGVERSIAVLFADLRGFTKLAEGRLPYDTVFILNRYFDRMGASIERAGGRIDKFIGDGIMALFGIEDGPAAGARSAILAVRGMAEALAELNRELAVELEAPLRIAVGLHLGPVILGEMGHGRAVALTAVGDTVNVASRLESVGKELDVQLVLSDAVAEHAGLPVQDCTVRAVDIRGRSEPLKVHLVADAATLPLLATPRPAPGWRRLAALAPVGWPQAGGRAVASTSAIRRSSSGHG